MLAFVLAEARTTEASRFPDKKVLERHRFPGRFAPLTAG